MREQPRLARLAREIDPEIAVPQRETHLGRRDRRQLEQDVGAEGLAHDPDADLGAVSIRKGVLRGEL